MNKNIKVLILHWGRRGGGPRYTLELTRAISQSKNIDIYLSLSRQSEIYDKFSSIPIFGRFDIDTYNGFWQFLGRSFILPSLRRKFFHYVREHDIDVVFCTMDHIWNPFVVGTICKSKAVYLLTVHDAARHPGEDQIWRRWLLRRDIKASDSALVLSRSVGESLRHEYYYPRDRVFLSTHGRFGDSNVEAKPRMLPANQPARLLFFGRIMEYKGLDLILRALPMLRRQFPTLKLEIWGYGDITPYRAALDALIDVRIENRWIAEDEIPDIFAKTDLIVLPYREASQSGVIATAFAYGMPCVVTPLPGLREQVDDGVTGVISSGFGAAEYAEAISRALRDPAFYARLSENCIHAARTTLSWKTISKSVADAVYGAYAKGKRAKGN
jgi:glycosyltransferase involved in cell wall biosynthesis